MCYFLRTLSDQVIQSSPEPINSTNLLMMNPIEALQFIADPGNTSRLANLFIGIGLLMIPITLIIRYLCVASTVQIFKIKRSFTKGAAYIMTWGGLRGGISIAMALSLPSDSHFRDLFILITYIIVLFSIIVQGLTVKSLVKYFLKQK